MSSKYSLLCFLCYVGNNGTENLTSFFVKLLQREYIHQIVGLVTIVKAFRNLGRNLENGSGGIDKLRTYIKLCYCKILIMCNRNQHYTDFVWGTRRNDNEDETERKWRAPGAVMQCIVGRAAWLTKLRLWSQFMPLHNLIFMWQGFCSVRGESYYN